MCYKNTKKRGINPKIDFYLKMKGIKEKSPTLSEKGLGKKY
jgi:hypothetical protein